MAPSPVRDRAGERCFDDGHYNELLRIGSSRSPHQRCAAVYNESVSGDEAGLI
jgi:hypothetical protein